MRRTTANSSTHPRLHQFGRTARTLVGLLGLCLLATQFASAQNLQGRRAAAADKAHRFLFTKERGEEILTYLHFGADYVGYHYIGYKPEGDDFALVYRFDWKTTDPGSTDVAFHCDGDGNVYQVSIEHTDAVLNQPFLFANLSIKVLGQLLIENNKQNMTEDDLRLARQIVEKADAKRLLELSLRLEQALGN
jgi:hypothetical protein